MALGIAGPVLVGSAVFQAVNGCVSYWFSTQRYGRRPSGHGGHRDRRLPLAKVAKGFVDRGRPPALVDAVVEGEPFARDSLGFPSGHAAMA